MTDLAQNVARGVCSKGDCTAAATGKCLDSYESLTDCPNFAIATPTVSVENNESTLTDEPVVSAEHTAQLVESVENFIRGQNSV